MASFVLGDGSKGFELAAGWHGNVCKRRLLCGKASGDAGGHHRVGNHQTAAGSDLEVRMQTSYTHT